MNIGATDMPIATQLNHQKRFATLNSGSEEAVFQDRPLSDRMIVLNVFFNNRLRLGFAAANGRPVLTGKGVARKEMGVEIAKMRVPAHPFLVS
jgi:hypothetical protein